MLGISTHTTSGELAFTSNRLKPSESSQFKPTNIWVDVNEPIWELVNEERNMTPVNIHAKQF